MCITDIGHVKTMLFVTDKIHKTTLKHLWWLSLISLWFWWHSNAFGPGAASSVFLAGRCASTAPRLLYFCTIFTCDHTPLRRWDISKQKQVRAKARWKWMVQIWRLGVRWWESVACVAHNKPANHLSQHLPTAHLVITPLTRDFLKRNVWLYCGPHS